MVAMNQIEAFAARIASEFSPQRIVLFGSHARERAASASDVDLLVIMPFKGRSVDQAVEIRLKTRPTFPLDLIVRTPESIEARLALGDAFIREVLETGKVLYEASRDTPANRRTVNRLPKPESGVVPSGKPHARP